jgi:hypothetical protein
MKKNYQTLQVRQSLKNKIKNGFLGLATLCCISTASNAQVGAALNFDGSNDFCNSAVFSNITNNITLQAKVFWTGTNGSQQFIVYNGNSAANGYGLFLPSGSNQVNCLYGGLSITGLFTLTPNTWTSISMIITTNLLTIYKDGVITNSIILGNPAVPSGGSFVIGSGPTSNTTFNGTVDEVLFWNVARTQCEIISFLNCEIPTSAPGLLANYHFNQGLASGSNGTVTTLIDASGNGNNLVLGGPFALTGSTSNWVAPGAVVSGFSVATTCSFGGEALDFDGVNDHINMGNLVSTQFANTLPYTVEAWIRPSSGFGGSTIAGMLNGGVTASWAFFLNANGSLSSYRNVGPFSLVTATNVVQANVWSHVATVYDGSTLYIYVNGQLATSGLFTSTQPGTSAPLIIGANLNSGSPTNFFNGRMDEVRIWNVARSQCQLNTFKNCEIPTSSAGLVANYHFNTGIPSTNNAGITTLFESTGNNLNGTLTNFTLTGSTSNWIAPGSVASGFTTTIAPLTPSILTSGSTTLCSPNSVSLTASNNASGLIFNGSTGNVSIPHNANQVPTNEMTIEGWIYPNNTGTITTNMIIMKGNYGYGLALGASGCSGGAKLNYWTSAGCGSAITSAGSVQFNTWSHVAVVVKLTPVQSLEFFINGVSAGTATTGININNGSNQALILGMQGTGCSCNYFNGRMDEIRLWSGARTQAQIIANMNSSIAANSPSLQLYLKADNTIGTTVTDLSSNSTNGTIVSGVTWEVPSSAPVNASTNYLWSTAATTSVINVNTTSANAVTITAATGCTSTANQAVTINALPTVSVNSGAICSGNSFTIVPSGANTYTIQGGSSAVTPIANANYSVTGTSTAGCVSSNTAISSVTVNALPTVSVNSGAICSGNSFTIIPIGANTYSIQGGSSTVTPVANANYNVTGTSTAGCVSSNTAVSSVTVNALPTVSVNSGVICSGNSFTIVPSGANTYSIQGGSSAVTPTANANYNVTGTSAAGCVSSNTAVSSVTVNALPTVSVNSGAICIGNSFTIVPSGANTYTISGGSSAVTPSVTSSYSVSGTGTNGCVGNTVSSVTVNSLPTVSAVSNASLICVGSSASLTASGATTYTWNISANTAVIAVSPTVTTTYTVNGTNDNGCSASAVIIQSIDACTSIQSAAKDFEATISVYPNPSNGIFTIEVPSSINISIITVLGKTVYNQYLQDGKHFINLSQFTNGLYILKAESNGMVKTVRLIKE